MSVPLTPKQLDWVRTHYGNQVIHRLLDEYAAMRTDIATLEAERQERESTVLDYAVEVRDLTERAVKAESRIAELESALVVATNPDSAERQCWLQIRAEVTEWDSEPYRHWGSLDYMHKIKKHLEELARRENLKSGVP